MDIKIAAPLILPLFACACAVLSTGARDTFAKRFSCPPDRVRVTARPDVPPHEALGIETRRTPPPANVAADPERLRYFREQRAAENSRSGASCEVYEATGCGQARLLCCAHPFDMEGDTLGSEVDCDGAPGWGATASGEIVSAGGPGGDWRVDVVSCEPPRPGDGAAVTVLIGKDGSRVGFSNTLDMGAHLQNLSDPSSRPVFLQEGPLDRAAGDGYRCLMSGDLGLRVSDAAGVGLAGTFRFACETKSGARITGHLALSYCP